MSIGCVMAKNCNVKCPAGLTTNPEMFEGDPRAMAQYLLNVAAEVREILAANGLAPQGGARPRRSAGRRRPPRDRRSDPARRTAGRRRGEGSPTRSTPSATTPLMTRAGTAGPHRVAGRCAVPRHHCTSAPVQPQQSVGAQLAIDIERMLNWELDPVTADALGLVLRDDRGRRYLSPDTVRIPTTGSAGQSYAAFCNDGMHMVHTGTCNDGVGKSMSGGTVVVRSPAAARRPPATTS